VVFFTARRNIVFEKFKNRIFSLQAANSRRKKRRKKIRNKTILLGGGPPPARKKCLNMFSSCKSESDKENFFLNLEIEDFSWQ